LSQKKLADVRSDLSFEPFFPSAHLR